MLSKDEILELTKQIDQQKSFVEGEQEGLKSFYDSLLGFEMRPDAFRTALKLRNLKPGALTAWLHTFDAVRDALGLDAQLDLEDAIAAQEKAADEELGIGKGKTKGNGRSKSRRAPEATPPAA